MTRNWRLAVVAALVLLAAPATWLRTEIPPPDYAAPFTVTALKKPQTITGDVTLLGAWRLDSENAHFGGYSALVALGNDRLLAGSDRGRLLEMPLPQAMMQSPLQSRVRVDFFAGTNGGPRIHVDLESLAYHGESEALWGAFEFGGRIQRFQYGNRSAGIVGITHPAMKKWPRNGGPETMIRLNDGRFIILAEASSGSTREGLIFAADPLRDDAPLAFRFAPPMGYSPVGGTLLPDGRVMILVRKVVWGLPPNFATALVIADPLDINDEEVWRGEVIAEISGPQLEENFEGLAAIAQDDGSVDLYLIADDNISAFQDTLMLRLNWVPAKMQSDSKKAREEPQEASAIAPD